MLHACARTAQRYICIVQIQFWYIHMDFEYIWKVSPLCMNECFTACLCKLQSRDKCRLFTHTVCTCRHLCTLSPKEKLSAVCSAKKLRWSLFSICLFHPHRPLLYSVAAVSTALRTGCHVKLLQCCHARRFLPHFTFWVSWWLRSWENFRFGIF